jgi:tetratricopeptide (TPR) repeat protein
MGRVCGRLRAVAVGLIACVALVPAFGGRGCAVAAPAAADTAKADTVKTDAASAIDSARRRVAGGDLSGAIEELAVYVAAHPKQLEPARYLGDLYYRASNVSAAESTYRAILKFAPDDRETHDRLGGIYAAQDRSDDAIAQFQASLPFASAYGHLVDVHRRIGDLPQFERSYREAADSAPFDAGAQYALGAVLRAEHRPSDAVQYLVRALNLSPRSCQTLSELGNAYLDLHEGDRAIGVLQRCLSMEPDDYPALVNLSSAYLEEGRDGDALPVVQHATRERPDQPEALVNLGYIEDDLGRWQNAMSYYLRAIALDPLDRDAYVDLGYDYSVHRLYALAEAALLKGLSVSPNDGRLHYLLASTYAEQGKRDLARAEYKRAAQSDEPEVARAANHDLVTFGG